MTPPQHIVCYVHVHLSRQLHQGLKPESSTERLKDYVGINLDLLSSIIDAEMNAQAKVQLTKLQKITESINKDSEDSEVDRYLKKIAVLEQITPSSDATGLLVTDMATFIPKRNQDLK